MVVRAICSAWEGLAGLTIKRDHMFERGVEERRIVVGKDGRSTTGEVLHSCSRTPPYTTAWIAKHLVQHRLSGYLHTGTMLSPIPKE